MSILLEEAMMGVKKSIEGYNAAIIANDLSAVSRAEKDLKSAEGKYNEQSMMECFDACKHTDNYVLEAVKVHDYEVVGHKPVRDDNGNILFAELVKKNKAIDLAKLHTHVTNGSTALWQYKTEKMGCLLCKRLATELGLSSAEIAKIDRMYYMSDFARKEELGVNPVSNTQMVRLLQTVVDSILFMEMEGDNKGRNALRVNNHDVAYLLNCYAKRDNKKILTVSVAKVSYINSLILDVLHRLVTGKSYDVSYKLTKLEDVKGDVVKKDDKKASKKTDVVKKA